MAREPYQRLQHAVTGNTLCFVYETNKKLKMQQRYKNAAAIYKNAAAIYKNAAAIYKNAAAIYKNAAAIYKNAATVF